MKPWAKLKRTLEVASVSTLTLNVRLNYMQFKPVFEFKVLPNVRLKYQTAFKFEFQSKA